jgi:hypothetical protein
LAVFISTSIGTAYAQEASSSSAAASPAPSGVSEAPLPASRSQRYLPPSLSLSDVRPPGFRIGDFIILSGAATSLALDDNVSADGEGRDSALLWSGSVQTRAQSNYLRHALGFDASAAASRALIGSDNDNFDWLLGSDGRLDLTRRSQLTGRLSVSHQTEDPEDAESEVSSNAYVYTARTGYSHQFARFSGGADAFVSRREEDDGDVAQERRRLDEDDEEFAESGDRTSYGVSFPFTFPATERLSFRVTPSWRRTLRDEEGEGDNNNSSDYQVFGTSIGASYVLDRGLTVSGNVGLQFRRDDDGDTEFDPAENLTFDWSLVQPIGGRTLVDVAASHSIADTSVEDATVRRNTRASTGVTYLVANNVQVRAQATFTRSDFVGTDRVDNSVAGQLSASWQLNARLSLNASYRYSQRFSDGGEDFYRNVISVGLSTQF